MTIVATTDATIVSTAAADASIGCGSRMRSTARMPTAIAPAISTAPCSSMARFSALP